MRPIELHVENFLGIKRADIRFEPGVYVLVGRNGSGKSSLFEAMAFALYGSGIRFPRNRVKNYLRFDAREAYLRFVFERRGKVYEVVRRLYRNRKNHQAILQSNGAVLAKGPDEVNRKIPRILGMDFDIFRRVFFIPQGEITSIVESRSGMREVVMKVLNFEFYKRKLQEKLNERMNDLKSKISDGELRHLEEMAKQLGGDPKKLGRRLEDLEVRRKKLENRKRELEMRRMGFESILEDLKRLRDLERELSTLKEKATLAKKVKKAKSVVHILERLDRMRSELDGVSSDLENIAFRKKQLIKQKSDLSIGMVELREKMEEIDEEISEKNEEIKRLRSILNEAEPILRNLESAKRLYEDKRSRLKEIEGKMEKLEKDIEKTTLEMEKLDEELKRAGERLARMEENQVEWMIWKISSGLEPGDTCPVCGSKIERLNVREMEFDFELYESLKKNMEDLKSMMDTKKGALNRLKEELGRWEEEREEVLQGLEKLKFEITDFEEHLKTMGYREELYEEYEKSIEGLNDSMRRKEELRKTLSSVETSLSSVETELSIIDENSVKLKVKRDKLEKELKALEHLANTEFESVGLSEEEVRRFSEMDVEEYEEYDLKMSEYETLKERMKTYESKGVKISDLEEEYRKIEEEIASLNDDIKVISEEMGEIRVKKDQLEGILKKIEELEESVERVSKELEMIGKLKGYLQVNNFDDFVFRKYMENVVEIADHELNMVTEGKFRLIMNGDSIDVVKDEISIPMNSLSGGEKTLVALMLAMGMSEGLVGNVEVLLIDEGFSALDSNNRIKVAEVLRSLEALNRVIIFITHFEDLKDIFDRKLVMEEGVLRVE